MTPTPKLRFVERESHSRNGEHFVMPLKIRVLQQWWELERNIIDMVAGKTQGEWRDVPLEKEE
jgi:hypothetical protein